MDRHAQALDRQRLVKRFAAMTLFGLLIAVLSLGWLHGSVGLVEPMLAAILAAGLSASLRSAWSHLPPFISRWIDAGVLLTVVLLAAASSGLSRGIPYAVLRWPEISAISISAVLAGTATIGFAYTHRRLAAEVEASARRLSDLEQAALQSRLSVLSAQIHPHFLFNTLNTLAELVHEDADLAEELVLDLSAMMRYALKSSAKRALLSEELDVVRRLLRIESARLGDRLTWSVRCDVKVDDIEIPGLLVQALVENAVRHGVAQRPEGGTVTVSVSRWVEGRKGSVEIAVEDDGLGIPPEVASALTAPGRGTAGAGGGLRNTALRAELTWPGEGRLRSVPVERGTRLVLSFPSAPESP